MAAGVRRLRRRHQPAAGTSGPGAAVPTVGALFTVSDGELGTHFCTASVVDSPAGDMLVTAAHCRRATRISPGRRRVRARLSARADALRDLDGDRAFVDAAWAGPASSVNDDVAFLTVAPSGGGLPLQAVTGRRAWGTSQPAGQVVRVTGYPDSQR